VPCGSRRLWSNTGGESPVGSNRRLELSETTACDGPSRGSIATPTREQLAKLDRKRVKKGSNQYWVNPHDPEAGITKLKDGRTHLAYKAEHAVDLETGAVVAVTVATGDAGDSETILQTLPQATPLFPFPGSDTSSMAAATRRWGPPGAPSTSRRSVIRRLGRTLDDHLYRASFPALLIETF
jgi:hypothetical protein